jgi:intracellular septation protein
VKNKSQIFTLFSFLPALIYWYLEETQPLEIALIGSLSISVVEIALEKIFTKHIHTISKLNFVLILILGGISLIAKEGIWFRLQPTFTGLCLGGYLLFKKLKKESLFIEMISDMGQRPPLPDAFYHTLESHLIIFILTYAAWMCYVAINLSTGTWLFWKTGGFYIALGIFMLLELILIRIYVRRKK